MSEQVVLMYHDVYVNDTSESGFQNGTALKYKVSASAFEQQVQAVANYLKEHDLPLDRVEFTFDDGGVSFLTVIASILEKYGFRGTFFITTGLIGTQGFLNVEQIQELNKRGHRVGSHSHSHPERMSALSPGQISEEWQVSQQQLLEVLGYKPAVASIPNGYSSRQVLRAMIDAGMSEIHTSEPISKTKHYGRAKIVGRYAVTDDYAVADVVALLSSPLTRFKMAFRYKLLGMAKTVLGDFYLTIRKFLTKK